MKRIGRMFRGLIRLAVITATLTGLIVVLDAVLSPDDTDGRG